MGAVTTSPAVVAFWKIHRFLLRVSRSRLFTRWGPGHQLLLTTRGRRSGQPRSVGLTYVAHDGGWLVVASNAGEERHPNWWLNLRADPHATVLIGGESFAVVAHEVSEPERSDLFARFVSETDESYLEYQRRTSRLLPVVSLSPAVPPTPEP